MTSAPEEKYHHKPWDIDPITIRMLKHAGLSPCDLPAPEEDGGDVHAIHYLHQGRIPLIYGKKPHDIEFAAERRERGKDEIVKCPEDFPSFEITISTPGHLYPGRPRWGHQWIMLSEDVVLFAFGDWDPTIQIMNTLLPEAMLHAMVGRTAHAIIEHPFLREDQRLVHRVTQNKNKKCVTLYMPSIHKPVDWMSERRRRARRS